jgi:hypothetical protein
MQNQIDAGKQQHDRAAVSAHGHAANESPALHPVVQLQQLAGNQAVQALLRSGMIQAKLTVSSPDDPEEREADNVAHTMMRKHAGAPCSCSPGEEMCEECQQKQSVPSIQRYASSPSSPTHVPRIVSDVLRSPGHPLDSATRAFFEPRFGRDFSNVRIHTGADAAASARSINALAYTAGEHLVFNAGEYAPHLMSGAHLLAHELTHVVQQSSYDIPPVRRKETPPKETQLEYIPENSMRANIQELEVTLPQFQDAVDKIDEHAILAAGDQIQAIWERVEGNYNDVSPLASVTTPSGGQAEGPKPEDVTRDFERARREVLESVSTQVFAGSAVLGKVTVPEYPGTLVPLITSQKAQVAWVAKDTATLIALLKREKLEEADQWQAVGLLRQHLNPWNFAYMLAAVRAAGLDSKFKSFAKGPADGYQTLFETAAQIKTIGEVGPSEEVGLLALIPAKSQVRLLQPLSPSQVSAEIYGREDLWQTLLVPFNPAELAGKGGQEWLMMGTELRVDPSMLITQYALIFSAAVQAQQRQQQKEGRPYLQTTGDRVAVVGNTITYFIQWPSGIWPDIKLQWWVEYDAAAVEAGLVDKVEVGPSGLVSAEGPSKSHDTTYESKPSVVGTHTVHCKLTYGSNMEDLSYQQTVITLEQKTQIEKARGFDYGVSSPKDILDQLRKELADTPDTPTYKEKREDLNKRINDIEQSLKDAGKQADRMDPIPATYISSADKPLRLPLRLFIGWDPEYDPGVEPDYNLKLWDYTLQGQPFTITARGERIMPAIEALLNTFSDKCYYPKGIIIAQISVARLAFSLVHDETLTLPTSGPKLIDQILQLLPPDVLRALSMGFLGLAVGSGLLGQEEVAIPAFEVSVYLGGAAAAEELAEKLEHGQFKADVSTAMQVADLAVALIGLGAEFEAATAVKGVGRVSLTPALSGLGKGIGYAQIGIIAGVHTAEIAAAVRSKDKDQVISAILRALGDAAFFFIVHKASAGLGAKGIPEGQPEFVPHDQLKALGADEAPAVHGHDVVVTEDGRVFRCSENCADLMWAFRQILDERPGIAKELKEIANKPKAQRIPAAKELLQRLEGLQHIRNLSNEELADRIAQTRGSKVETELKLERLRREGVELSADEILEASDINARRSPGGKGVPDPFETGNFAHAMYERLDELVGGARVTSDTLLPGLLKEYTIPDTRLPYDRRPRIDRLSRAEETIYEIKPTTEKVKGDAQARGYAELMDRFEPLPGGRRWKYQTITYDEARVTQFLKDKGVLQKKSAGSNTNPSPAAFSRAHEVLRSSGQPLDAGTRAFYEPRLGRDFSDVRIHTGPDAAASARSINAHAYTVGSHIVFASGQYSPDTPAGRSLLAHELVHTMQRGDATVWRQPAIPLLKSGELDPSSDMGSYPERTVSSMERLGPGASDTAKVKAATSHEGTAGQIQEANFHLEATGQGKRGSVSSSTGLNLSFDPRDKLLEGFGNEIRTVPTGRSYLAYPVVIRYSRTLNLTDARGRKCTVEVQGAVFLTGERFLKEIQFKQINFDSLTQLTGDMATVKVTLQGSGPVQSYLVSSDVDSTDAGLSSLSSSLSRSLGMPRTGPGLISKAEAHFVEPELTAGEQFDSLEEFLESADTEEISRRVMADLDYLTSVPAERVEVKREKAEPEEEPGILASILKATGIGLLVVAAILVLAEATGVSIALASAAVLGTLLASSFVNNLMNRYKEASATDVGNPASIFSTAVLDTLGLSEVEEAITDKSLLTGRKLNRSPGQRIGAGLTGAFQFGLTLFGIRGKPSVGMEEPNVPRPSEPTPVDPWELAAPEGPTPTSPAHAGGAMGEADAAFVLGRSGMEVVTGPAGPAGHGLTECGFDCIAFRPANDEVWIIDNKAIGAARRVQEATAITDNLSTNLRNSIQEIEALQDFPKKDVVLQKLRDTLTAVQAGSPLPSGVRLVVTNAGGYATGIGRALASKGVEFVDVIGRDIISVRKTDIRAAKAQGAAPGRLVRVPDQ